MLVRPAPHIEESLQSYVLRLCSSNGLTYEAFRTFISKNYAPFKSYEMDDRHKISNYLVRVTKYEKAGELIDVSEVANQYLELLNMKSIKLCPCCYSEKPIIFAAWYFKSYVVCNRHNTMMIDSCPQCRALFNENTLIRKKCSKCNFTIDDIEPISAEVDRYSKIIAQRFLDQPLRISEFIQSIKSNVVYFNDELLAFDKLMSYFEPIDKIAKKNRRIYNIQMQYSKQINSSELFDNPEKIKEMILMVAQAHAKKSEIINAGNIYFPFNQLVGKIGSEFMLNLLRNVLLSDDPVLNQLTAGGAWIERIFVLNKREFTSFVKDNFSELLIKKQGGVTIPVSELGMILGKFNQS